MAYIVGIDIGGTSVKLGLFDTSLDTFTDKWEIKTNLEDNGSHILSDTNDSIREKLKSKKNRYEPCVRHRIWRSRPCRSFWYGSKLCKSRMGICEAG